MTKHVRAFTYEPKIEGVRDGSIKQTIRFGHSVEEGEVGFNGNEEAVPIIEADEQRNDAFWNLPRRPKDLKEYDYIWFVLEGEIYAWATVDKIEESEEECDFTGKKWKGCQIWFVDAERVPEDYRVKMKGFQGFRYKKKGQRMTK